MTRMMSKPLQKTYTVDDWEVTFIQMTDGDWSAMGDLEGQREIRYNPDGTFRGYGVVFNDRRTQRLGIYRTMVSCTLQWGDEDDVTFKSKDGRVKNAMSEKDFNTQWDMLSLETANALIEKFEEHNPILKPGESKATSKKSA